MPDSKRGGYISERTSKKRTVKRPSKSRISQSEIMEAMDKRGVNDSCSRITAGKTVIFSRDRRY